ncbi:MAG TPA: lysophospholipid acyltransferase family protein [Novosphingobium sp.]|nr:lysophospholipid acyltransferase family protein [Novosphingobium sp.]
MLALLLACVPLYGLWQVARARLNPWPRRFLSGIARIAGVRIGMTGPVPRGGVFLLANHVSWIDIPVLSATSGAAFVGHDGLASMPLLRWLCAMNDTGFVARHDRASVARQVEQVREALRDTGALAIFPEGTTSDGTGLLTFKSSLLSALVPVPPLIAVHPVWLDYGPDSANLAWVGEEHGLANFRRILGRADALRVTVHFLPALDGEALASRKTMAAAAREAIATAMSG